MSKTTPASLKQFQVAKPKNTSAPTLHSGEAPHAAPSRERIQKTFRIQKVAAKQLALLKLHAEKNQEDLLAEALNLLFEQYGMPPVA